MFNYHFHYVGLCLMQAGDLVQNVPENETTKGPRPTKLDSGLGSESTSKTQLVSKEQTPLPNPCMPESTASEHHQPSLRTINLEPGAHHQQLHQQPPDPGIQEGGTSDEDYGLQETAKGKFSRSKMVCGNIIYVQSHASKVEQNEGNAFKKLPNRLNNINYCTVPNWFMVKQWHTMSESCIVICHCADIALSPMAMLKLLHLVYNGSCFHGP